MHRRWGGAQVAARAGELARRALVRLLGGNTDLNAAYDALRAVYLAEGQPPRYHPEWLNTLLAQWHTPEQHPQARRRTLTVFHLFC
jgi:hypothetical protein